MSSRLLFLLFLPLSEIQRDSTNPVHTFFYSFVRIRRFAAFAPSLCIVKVFSQLLGAFASRYRPVIVACSVRSQQQCTALLRHHHHHRHVEVGSRARHFFLFTSCKSHSARYPLTYNAKNRGERAIKRFIGEISFCTAESRVGMTTTTINASRTISLLFFLFILNLFIQLPLKLMSNGFELQLYTNLHVVVEWWKRSEKS